MTSTSKWRRRNNQDSFLSQSSASSDNDEDLPDIPTTSTRTRHANDTIDRRAARNVAVFNAELIEGLLDGHPATQEIEARERADALRALQEQRAKKKKDKGKGREAPTDEVEAEASTSGSSAKRRRVIIESEDEEEQDELQDDQDEDAEVASNLLNANASQSQCRASTSVIPDTAPSASSSTPIHSDAEYPDVATFIQAAQAGLVPIARFRMERTAVHKRAYGERYSVECDSSGCSAHVTGQLIAGDRRKAIAVRLQHSDKCHYNPPQSQTPASASASVTQDVARPAGGPSSVSVGAEYPNLATFVQAAQTSLTRRGQEGVWVQQRPGGERVTVQCKACIAHVTGKLLQGDRWQAMIVQLQHADSCPDKPVQPFRGPSNEPGDSRRSRTTGAPSSQSTAAQAASRNNETRLKPSYIRASQHQDQDDNDRDNALKSHENEQSHVSQAATSGSLQEQDRAPVPGSAVQASPSSGNEASHSTASLSISVNAEYPNLDALSKAAQARLTSSPHGQKRVEIDISLFGDRFTMECKARVCLARVSARRIEKNKDPWRVSFITPQHDEACPYQADDFARAGNYENMFPQSQQTAPGTLAHLNYNDGPYTRTVRLTVGTAYPTYHHLSGAAIEYLFNQPAQFAKHLMTRLFSRKAGRLNIKIQCRTPSCNAHVSTEQPTGEEEWIVIDRSLRHLRSCPNKPPKSPRTAYVESFSGGGGSSHPPAAPSAGSSSQARAAPSAHPPAAATSQVSTASTANGQPTSLAVLVNTIRHVRNANGTELSAPINIGWTFTNAGDFAHAAIENLTSLPEAEGRKLVERRNTSQGESLVYDLFKCFMVNCHAHVLAARPSENVWRISRLDLQHHPSCPVRPSVTRPLAPLPGPSSAAPSEAQHVQQPQMSQPVSQSATATQNDNPSSADSTPKAPDVAIGAVYLDYDQFSSAAIQSLTHLSARQAAADRVEEIKVAQAGVYDGASFRCKGLSCGAEVKATHIKRDIWRVSSAILIHSTLCPYQPTGPVNKIETPPIQASSASSANASSSHMNGSGSVSTTVPSSVSPAVENRPVPQQDGSLIAPLLNGHAFGPEAPSSASLNGDNSVTNGMASQANRAGQANRPTASTSATPLANGNAALHVNGSSTTGMDVETAHADQAESSRRKGKRRASQQDMGEDSEDVMLRVGRSYNSLPHCRTAALCALDRQADDIDTVRRVVDGVNTVIYKCWSEGCTAYVEADLPENDWMVKAMDLEHIPACSAAHPKTLTDQALPPSKSTAEPQGEANSSSTRRPIGSPRTGRKTTRPPKRRKTASPLAEPANGQPEQRGAEEALPTGTRFDTYDELLAASASALSRDPVDLIMSSGDVPPNSRWMKLVCKNHNPHPKPYRRGLANLTQTSTRDTRPPAQSRCQARVSAEVDPATKEHIVVRARYEHSVECNQVEFGEAGTNAAAQDEDEDLARAIAASQALAEQKAKEADIQAVKAMERREEQAKRKNSFSPTAEDAMQATALALSDVFDSAASVRAAMIGALGRAEEDLVVQFEYASKNMPQYGRMLVRCKRCSLILPRSNVDVTNLVDEPKEVLPGPRCNAVVTAEEHYGDWKVVFIQLAHSEACQDVNRLQQAPFTSNRRKSGAPASSAGDSSMQIDTHVEAVQEGGEVEAGVSAIEPAAGPSALVPLASPATTVENPPAPVNGAQQPTLTVDSSVKPSQQKRPITVIEISDSEDEQEAQPTLVRAMIPKVKKEPKSPGPTPEQALPSATTTEQQLASNPSVNTSAQPIAHANHAATQALEALQQSHSASAASAPSGTNSESTSAMAAAASSVPTAQSSVSSRPPLRIPEPASRRRPSTEGPSNDQVSPRVWPPAFGEGLPDIATFRRRVEEHSRSTYAGRTLVWNERMHRLSCPTRDCPYTFGAQINAGNVGVILARPRHSEACMHLEEPPRIATDTSADGAGSNTAVASPQATSALQPEGLNSAEAPLPDVTVKPEEVDVTMDDAAPEPELPAEYDPVHHPDQHEEEGLKDDFVETSTPSRAEVSAAMKRSGKASRSRSTNRQTVTPSTSTTTSRGGRGKCRYADPPSPSPSSSDIPKARSQYRPDGTPRVPRSGYRYESEQDLEARIRAYSKYLNPAAKLRKRNKRKNTLSLICTHPDCNFHFFAENERRKEDGVVAQGMLILESQPRHSQACTDTEGQASSPLATPRSKAVARLGGRASILSVRSASGNSDAESVGDSSRNARKQPSLARQERQKRRRTLGANGLPSQQGGAAYHSGDDKSATPVDVEEAGVMRNDLAAPGAAASGGYVGGSAQTEVPAAREPQRGETLPNVQEFEELVNQHNRYVNPESKAPISISQDGRVSFKCTRKLCSYSFAGKKLSSKSDSPVQITSTIPFHSDACRNYYNHDGYRYAPKKGETVSSWERFHEMVEEHSHMLNPGAVLQKEVKEDRQKIFCDGDEEVRCSYQFNARYFPRGENVGTIEITVSDFIHSDDCLEHYGNLVRPANRSSGSRADTSANNADEEGTPEPGTILGTLYEDEDDFKNVVTEHSQRKAPGAALVWKRTKKYVEGQCKYYYAGCRYEFHAAKYIEEQDQKEKLVLTDVKRIHNKDCERERMLMLAGAGMVKGDSSEGSRRPRRSNVKRNGSSLAHLSASGASDSSWQENDTVDTTMMNASAADAPGPLATSTPMSRPALVAPIIPRPPGPSPNMASPALTPPIANISAVPAAPAAFVIESSPPAEVKAPPFIDENLETIYLPHGVLPILQQFHYNKVSDLSEAGVTNADWPQLLLHLEELASFSHLEEEGESLLSADPVAGFIFEKRAAAALSMEYINRYHAQMRMPEPDGPLQL